MLATKNQKWVEGTPDISVTQCFDSRDICIMKKFPVKITFFLGSVRMCVQTGTITAFYCMKLHSYFLFNIGTSWFSATSIVIFENMFRDGTDKWKKFWTYIVTYIVKVSEVFLVVPLCRQTFHIKIFYVFSRVHFYNGAIWIKYWIKMHFFKRCEFLWPS